MDSISYRNTDIHLSTKANPTFFFRRGNVIFNSRGDNVLSDFTIFNCSGFEDPDDEISDEQLRLMQSTMRKTADDIGEYLATKAAKAAAKEPTP